MTQKLHSFVTALLVFAVGWLSATVQNQASELAETSAWEVEYNQCISDLARSKARITMDSLYYQDSTWTHTQVRSDP